jgi:hypothetical protein
MNTITKAWEAFIAAVAEAQHLHRSGGAATTIRDSLQHARELLAIIDDEIALHRLDIPAEVRRGLEHLRAQLAAVESGLVTRH